MITYEKYAEIRDRKNLTDGKVAEMAGFGRSTFSDWKSGRSNPKADKLQKIADALDMDYFDFVGPVGKFSSQNPDKPDLNPSAYVVKIPGTDERIQIVGEDQNEVERITHFIESYLKADQDTRTLVQLALKSRQSDSNKKQ